MVYLDNSATTLKKPESVYREITDVMKMKGGNPGRGGHLMAQKAADVIFKARENVGKYFNIDNESCICFTFNASLGLNYAIKGLLKKNDHVIISAYEHNSVYRPVCMLNNIGVQVTVLPSDPDGNFDNIENYIRNNTKLIIINHVSNVTGNIAEIKSLSEKAHNYGIIFMVDASQSAGHIEMDLEEQEIDIMVCSGHKGLFGPQGTGILYIKKGIELDTIIEGGTGSFSADTKQPYELPDRFETGTLNTPGIGGLSKGIEFLLDVGTEKIREHEQFLIKQMIDGLKSIKGVEVYGNCDYRKTSGALGFNVGTRDCEDVAAELSEKYNIFLRSGLHCSYLAHRTIGTLKKGCLRASVSYFTTYQEINYFLNIIDKISK